MPKTYLGNHIKGQLIRCSSSVAANYRAAFASKLSIVIEEADEAKFWLEFIIDEGLKSKRMVNFLKKEAHELASIFIVSRKTIQKNKK